jgi:hypothetical protein
MASQEGEGRGKVVAIIIIALTVFGLPAVTGTGAYISARILFPQMGLNVPDWSAFYWSNVFIVIVLIAVYLWNEVLESVFK